MIAVNFLPWRETLRAKNKKIFIGMTVVTAFIATFCVYLSYLWAISHYDAQQARNSYLTDAIKVVSKDMGPLRPYKVEFENLTQRFESIQALSANSSHVASLFGELADVLPEGAYYDSVHYQSGRMNLEGKALSSRQVSEILENIQNAKLLTNANLTEVRQDARVGEIFNLELDAVLTEISHE